MGYLRRDDIRRNYALFRFSPRPKTIESIRKFSTIGSLTYTENGAGRLETRIADGEFGIEFQTSDFSSQFSVEPSVSINALDLPQGSVTTKLVGLRATYTISPMMFVSAFVQYNSSTNTVSTNARLRWEYRPGSELFVVYNEERDTMTTALSGTRNHGLVFKINRLFQM